MAGSPTIGDVYEITVDGAIASQAAVNVYFYEVRETWLDTNPTFAQALVEDFRDNTLPDILACQAGDYTVSLLRCRNLYDEADAYSLPVSLAGTKYAAAVDTLGAFEALAFNLGGETSAVKNGAKRLAGIANADVQDGIVTASSLITAAATAAEMMERPLQVGFLIGSDVAWPVLVKRVRTGTPGAYEYRLPTSQGEGITTTIINALFNVLVSSQVSRKIGIGV